MWSGKMDGSRAKEGMAVKQRGGGEEEEEEEEKDV